MSLPIHTQMYVNDRIIDRGYNVKGLTCQICNNDMDMVHLEHCVKHVYMDYLNCDNVLNVSNFALFYHYSSHIFNPVVYIEFAWKSFQWLWFYMVRGDVGMVKYAEGLGKGHVSSPFLLLVFCEFGDTQAFNFYSAST